MGVAVDATGSLYVAENGNDRIRMFADDDQDLLDKGSWGSSGSGEKEFKSANGAAQAAAKAAPAN